MHLSWAYGAGLWVCVSVFVRGGVVREASSFSEKLTRFNAKRPPLWSHLSLVKALQEPSRSTCDGTPIINLTLGLGVRGSEVACHLGYFMAVLFGQ